MKRRKKISFEFFSIFFSVNCVCVFLCSAVRLQCCFLSNTWFPFCPYFLSSGSFILCLFVWMESLTFREILSFTIVIGTIVQGANGYLMHPNTSSSQSSLIDFRRQLMNYISGSLRNDKSPGPKILPYRLNKQGGDGAGCWISVTLGGIRLIVSPESLFV